MLLFYHIKRERKLHQPALIGQRWFNDVAFESEGGNTEAVDLAIGGGDQDEIPVAEHGQEEELAEPKDHT